MAENLKSAANAAVPQNDASWPADVDPNSGFRLPLLNRDDLDDHGKLRFDNAVNGGNIAGLQGPTGIALYSPRTENIRHTLSRYLRHEAELGARVRELALLITSRSFDNQFEWTAHEPEALKAGIPQDVIDVIKFHRSTEGLDPVDAVVIDLGRAVWKAHKVEPELFARARDIFGPRKLVDLVLLMGTHAGSGALLATFGMQLHKGKTPLLPIP